MTLPKVTIVTTTYNLLQAGRKNFFLKAVESVKSQSYKNIEHIIIDGASTDGTIELIESTGVTYFSEPDTGIYNAFNKGIQHAKGKYIAFLNSDDFYTRPDAVTMVVSALEESKADFSCAPFDVVEYDGKYSNTICPCLEHFPLGMPIGHPTMFASKEMLESLNGFDESYRITADFDLINRALLKGYAPIKIENSFIAFRKGGISNAFVELSAKEDIKVITKTLNISEKEAQQMRANGYVPKAFLKELLRRLSPQINTSTIAKFHRKRELKHIKQKLFYVRWRQDKKVIRLLGITFYSDWPTKNERSGMITETSPQN